MKNTDQAIDKIIAQCRLIFIPDTLEQINVMQNLINTYYHKRITLEALNIAIYQHSHSIKGIALTIGYEEIHRISEIMTEQIRASNNTIDIDTMLMFITSLADAVNIHRK
jgi:chemotaxis protein histidine kinase CheA